MTDSLTARLELMLVEQEDEVLHAYRDHLGYLTIGVGILIDQRKGGGITQEESRYLLRNRIALALREVSAALPWFSNLCPARQAVLISMRHQMGLDGLLEFKNTLGAIRDGRWQDARTGMLKSLWAQQTPARARTMAKQMLTGEWQ